MIDSSSAQNRTAVAAGIQQIRNLNVGTNQMMMEESKTQRNETVDMGLAILMELRDNDLGADDVQYRDTVQTIFKIITNLVSKPLDPQVRKLNKTNKAVQ